MHSKDPGFCLMGRAGVVVEFFDFFCSQSVIFKFSQGPQVLNVFPHMFLIAPHLLCPKWLSFHLCRWTKRDSLHLPKENFILGSLQSVFLVG
jgi:hypothetical protein